MLSSIYWLSNCWSRLRLESKLEEEAARRGNVDTYLCMSKHTSKHIYAFMYVFMSTPSLSICESLFISLLFLSLDIYISLSILFTCFFLSLTHILHDLAPHLSTSTNMKWPASPALNTDEKPRGYRCACVCIHVYTTCRCNDFALLSIAWAAACACDYKQRKKSGRTSSAPLPGPPPFLRPLVTKRDRIYPSINPSFLLL